MPRATANRRAYEATALNMRHQVHAASDAANGPPLHLIMAAVRLRAESDVLLALAQDIARHEGNGAD